MKKRIEDIVISAVTTPATSFTWMKYKGVKGKLLTHVKRNGDEVKAKLLPGDVYGYRLFKKRGNPVPLIQIVLKSDGMDLTYNLNEKTFNSVVLKHSKATALPKAFKKGIDTTIIDKKAKATPKLDSKTPKGSTDKKPKSARVSKHSKVQKIFEDVFKRYDGAGTYLISISPKKYTVKLNPSSSKVSVNLMYFDLMSELKDAFGKKPTTLARELEEQVRTNTQIIVCVKEVGGETFLERTKTTENSMGQTKIEFAEFIFEGHETDDPNH